MPLVLYPSSESEAEVEALTSQGKTPTFDTAHPIPVVPTAISGPEPGNKDSGEQKTIEVMLSYRTAQGETGTINLEFWTPAEPAASLTPEQRAMLVKQNWRLHDMGCRGVP
jgi:hypothetical protein